MFEICAERNKFSGMEGYLLSTLYRLTIVYIIDSRAQSSHINAEFLRQARLTETFVSGPHQLVKSETLD